MKSHWNFKIKNNIEKQNQWVVGARFSSLWKVIVLCHMRLCNLLKCWLSLFWRMTNCSKVTYLATHHQLFALLPKVKREVDSFKIETTQLVMKHCGFRLRRISRITLGLNVRIVLVFEWSSDLFHFDECLALFSLLH